MKQPLWKHWLSYFTELEIEHSSSEYNEKLHLLYSKGQYQLCTDGAIYSYGTKYDNFVKAFHHIGLGQRDIEEVLVLGFGLGSITQIIEQTFQKKCFYIGVELDGEIIRLASKYVLDDLHSKIDIIQADAYHFLSIHDEKYDLICMDVFEDDVIPEDFNDVDFLEMIVENLHENGVFIFNRLAFTEADKTQSRAYYEDVFCKVFPQSTILDVGGNYMLIYDASKK